jgi:exopolyphosphatase/guanosine-5'-triphosphate,3'-diphosphate pyrophosphatase
MHALRIVRLGEGVDASGSFSEAALERTFDACTHYAQIIEDLQARLVRFVATSASRDASNRDAFIAGVRATLGQPPR